MVDRSEPATEQSPVVNELDVAYEMIPVDMRPELEAAAHERLDAEGVPGWMRIMPTVRAAAVRLWQGARL